MNLGPLILLGAFLVGAYMLLAQRQGSGGGAVTTEGSEGTWFDPEGVYNEAANAIAGGSAPADNPQTLSLDGLARLEVLEGFSATPYSDFKGYSIGYGHLIQPGENLTVVTRDQAREILSSDVAWAEAAVRDAIHVPLTQAQFDALVSFAFNVGQGAFKRSTLVKRINAGDPGASSEFDRWVYAGGRINGALENRRRAERALYESALA